MAAPCITTYQHIYHYKLVWVKYFFWVCPRRLSANSRRFRTLYRFHLQRQVNEVYFIDLPLKMELIQCSETSAISTETLGKHPKEIIFHLTHGESLKSSVGVCMYVYLYVRMPACMYVCLYTRTYV
jgi:hypothetical protein